jgi:cathepsin L
MSVDCDSYNYACLGGDFTMAWKYMEDRGGAMKTSVYPYVSGTTKTVNPFGILSYLTSYLLYID